MRPEEIHDIPVRDTALLKRIRESIAEEVAAEMGRQCRTQEDLEAATGISQSAISYRLRGISAFHAEELVVIARFLGVPVTQFFEACPARLFVQATP